MTPEEKPQAGGAAQGLEQDLTATESTDARRRLHRPPLLAWTSPAACALWGFLAALAIGALGRLSP
jgi:hypothetical protein